MSKNLLGPNFLRWATLYLFLALIVLLLYAVIFPANSSASNSAANTSTNARTTTHKTTPNKNKKTSVTGTSPTVTPSTTVTTSSPTNQVTPLDQTPQLLILNNFDPNGLANGMQSEIDKVNSEIDQTANPKLKHRQAALVIIYIDTTQISNGQAVAKEIENLLTKYGMPFVSNTTYQLVLSQGAIKDGTNTYPGSQSSKEVDLEIYLFAQ